MQRATVIHRSRVLYLVGMSRSGSTLVGSLLGQVPGIVHVGELALIWQDGLIGNHRCGCGEPFADCKFWRAVLDKAFLGHDRIDPRRMIDMANRFSRIRHALGAMSPRGRRSMRRGMAQYSDATARIYQAILETTGATTVLDSSKVPMLAWLMGEHPDVDLWPLHVTRDPRAVVYSWQRKKFDPAKGANMPQGSTLLTSLSWLAFNGIATALWSRRGERYLQIRYEDLTSNPRGVLDRILEWFGEPMRASQIIDTQAMFTEMPAHTIAGNPMRFEHGRKKIETDTEWQEKLSAWDAWLTAGVTWPLLGRYRYPIVP